MSLPAAILAGGLATRLRPITETIPKALIEVAGVPFAEHQIRLLRDAEITRIVFCVGYLGEMVQQSLGDGSHWGVQLEYSFDGPTLLGTGGSLRNALSLLGEAFFVLYGDSYLECSYQAVEQTFHSSGKTGLMTVFHNDDRWDRSNVVFKDGRILQYRKQDPTPDMHFIDYGLGVLRAGAFEAYLPHQAFDLSTVYQDLIAQDQLSGFEVHQRFYEIGSPDGLEETRQHLMRKATL